MDKRCVALIALGALHFTFLWHGDIIFLYGIFGLLLTFFFFCADRTLKIWAGILFLLSSTVILLAGILIYLLERYFPEESYQAAIDTELDAVLLDGSFLEAIPARLDLWVGSAAVGIFLQGGMAFAAFLLGLRLARTNFLSSPIDKNKNASLMKKGFFLGAPIQIVAAVILVRNEQSADPSEAIHILALFSAFIAAPLLSMFYIGLFRKLVEEKPHLVSWMMSTGKMSLTVYISQSVITLIIFSSWGLGLFQDLQTWQVVFLAIGIWLLLVFLSNYWLKRFNQGPLERLVNTLTRNR